MKIKVSEASGPALDWMVAKAQGLLAEDGGNLSLFNGRVTTHTSTSGSDYNPSESKDLCREICGAMDIQVRPCAVSEVGAYQAVQASYKNFQVGPTPLVAAMRCFCRSKLGDEVEVPDELL